MSRTLLLLGLSLISVACCQRGTGSISRSAAGTATNPTARRAATSAATADRVLAEIQLVEQSPKEARFRWRITNPTTRPVWVPVKWGMSEASMEPLPLPMLMPPGDLTFVFADFVGTAPGRGQIIEGREQFESVEMDGGALLTGEVTLPLPYDPSAGQRERLVLLSPYAMEGGITPVTGKTRPLTRVAAVQLVVRYWDHDPQALRTEGDPKRWATDPAYRLTAARVVVLGGPSGYVEPKAFEHFAVSDRVETALPVAPGVSIYAP